MLTPKWRERARAAPAGADRLAGQVRCSSRSSALGFWTAVFGIAYRVLQLLPAAWRTSATCWPARCSASSCSPSSSILLLSNIITALSTFFLAKDLDLLVAAPVGWLRLYLAKLVETVVHSSWMVALLALPILTAYGIVYSRRAAVPVRRAGGLRPVPRPAGGGRDDRHLLLVNVFPARRTRELLGLIGIGAVVVRRADASGSSGPSSWPGRRGSGTSWTTSRCCGRRPARCCRASGPPT